MDLPFPTHNRLQYKYKPGPPLLHCKNHLLRCVSNAFIFSPQSMPIRYTISGGEQKNKPKKQKTIFKTEEKSPYETGSKQLVSKEKCFSASKAVFDLTTSLNASYGHSLLCKKLLYQIGRTKHLDLPISQSYVGGFCRIKLRNLGCNCLYLYFSLGHSRLTRKTKRWPFTLRRKDHQR